MPPLLSDDAEGSSTTCPNQADALLQPEFVVDGLNNGEICKECGTTDPMFQSPVCNNDVPIPGLRGLAAAASIVSLEPIAEA